VRHPADAPKASYDRTTAAEIAARASVTERTFFLHFADKREILFEEGSSSFLKKRTKKLLSILRKLWGDAMFD
jgi:AcrR family transcriptional regulator